MRRLSRFRFILPAALMALVGFASLLSFSVGAGAQGSGAKSGSYTGPEPAVPSQRYTPGLFVPSLRGYTGPVTCRNSIRNISFPGPVGNGTPVGLPTICVNGHVVLYGHGRTITYHAPSSSFIAPGRALFQAYCASCHGDQAQGSSAAPNIAGLGPAAVDFWVSTGRMPAATPLEVQAQQKPAKLDRLQTRQIAAYVNSLYPRAPYIPVVNVKAADLTDGASLFALNCAACHTITGAGDELAYGTNAPTLHGVAATQVAEAIRTGPGNMPWFTGNLSDAQVRDIVAYVTTNIQHPANPGGAGLGGVGPVAEGFVALLFGVGIFMLICFWIGDRSES